MKMDEAGKKSLLEKSMQYLLETHGNGIVVQHIIRKATDTVIDMMNKPSDFDPYKTIKTYSNDIALEHYQMFKTKIKESRAPLQTALKIAAAGNIIDFGAKNHVDLDIEKELGSIDQRGFGIYHYDEFYKRLSSASVLLYICDNSGGRDCFRQDFHRGNKKGFSLIRYYLRNERKTDYQRRCAK